MSEAVCLRVCLRPCPSRPSESGPVSELALRTRVRVGPQDPWALAGRSALARPPASRRRAARAARRRRPRRNPPGRPGPIRVGHCHESESLTGGRGPGCSRKPWQGVSRRSCPWRLGFRVTSHPLWGAQLESRASVAAGGKQWPLPVGGRRRAWKSRSGQPSRSSWTDCRGGHGHVAATASGRDHGGPSVGRPAAARRSGVAPSPAGVT